MPPKGSKKNAPTEYAPVMDQAVLQSEPNAPKPRRRAAKKQDRCDINNDSQEVETQKRSRVDPAAISRATAEQMELYRARRAAAAAEQQKSPEDTATDASATDDDTSSNAAPLNPDWALNDVRPKHGRFPHLGDHVARMHLYGTTADDLQAEIVKQHLDTGGSLVSNSRDGRIHGLPPHLYMEEHLRRKLASSEKARVQNLNEYLNELANLNQQARKYAHLDILPARVRDAIFAGAWKYIEERRVNPHSTNPFQLVYLP